ncbi:MAG: DUF6089 family protein [Bacteroidales bacterium]
MPKVLLNCILICIILVIDTKQIHAQEYMFEAGASGGINYYIGDVSNKLFYNIGSDIGALFRYNLNLRNAFKLNIGRNHLRSDSNNENNISPYHPYRFNRSFLDLSGNYEYSFFSYSDLYEYSEARKYTPYIYIGIGYLQSLDGKRFDSLNVLTLPFGIGFKYKIRNRVNLGIEYSMTWCSSDKLDGLDDPYDISSSSLKNKDWYSTLKVFITYDFCKKRCNCPRDYK